MISHAGDEPVYFRGTSEGFPGHPSLQYIRVTPVTTDPVVATIFAVEASNFGHGVIYIARLADLAGVSIIPGNALAALEAEVGLAMVPLEFARRATRVVSTTDARMLLLALGITIRPSIRGPASVQIALEESPRLDPTRIQRFLRGVDRLESPI